MAPRSVYLAKNGGSKRQRARFAVFIPREADNNTHNSKDFFKESECSGTIIQVAGEPLTGFRHGFKRNYPCHNTADPLQKLVYLGAMESSYLYDAEGRTVTEENIARSTLEQEAIKILPPSGNQDIRAPINGVNTKRCQEWTMEFLHHIVQLGFISADAIANLEGERDAPTHGIFWLQGLAI